MSKFLKVEWYVKAEKLILRSKFNRIITGVALAFQSMDEEHQKKIKSLTRSKK